MNDLLQFQWAGIIVAIILVDLTLSGDNALVIGAAAAKLKGPSRAYAITFGGVMAIILRIALAFGAVLLLNVPYVKVVAGLAVFWIALQLISDMYKAEEELDVEKQKKRFGIGSDTTFLKACITIVIADVSMSTDNILAIAALSRGNFLLLAIGLVLSIGFLLIASSIIAKFIERFPALLYVAGLILAFTAGSLIVGDKVIIDATFQPVIYSAVHQIPGPFDLLVEIGLLVIFSLVAYVQWLRRPKKSAAEPALSTPDGGAQSKPR